MKKVIFSLVLALVLTACVSIDPKYSSATISFEDAVLDENNVMFSTPYSEESLTFSNYYDPEYLYWEDFAISAVYDDTTPDYTNMFGSITASAYEGNNFAVIFQGYYGVPTISCDNDFWPNSLHITNSTYTYNTILNGNAYSEAFADGDFFYVTITGYDSNDVETGHVDVYLADYREGKSEILNTWNAVDLSAIGFCRKMTFTFTSSQNNEFGILTPAYALIDNLLIKY